MFRERPLTDWLALLDGEDVAVGPVASLDEAAAHFAEPPPGDPPGLGEHTDAWRRVLTL